MRDCLSMRDADVEGEKQFKPKNDQRSDPNGTRTRVAGVKGRSPRPLDDGAAAGVAAQDY